MFEKFPSLLGFQPKFYRGGPGALHLPVLYDLVANTRPRLMVTLGLGHGQAFFTLCQAAQELGVASRCVAIRRDDGDEADDVSWLEAKTMANECYAGLAELRIARLTDTLVSLA